MAEIEGSEGVVEAQRAVAPLREVLRRPALLATAWAFFGFAYALFFFLTWYPSYLIGALHMDLGRMSVVSVIPWTVGFVGMVGGGLLSDLLFRRTGRAVHARKVVLIGGMCTTAVASILAGQATDVTSAVSLATLAVFGMYVACNTYFALVLDTVDPSQVGTATGFVHAIANCSGIVGPILTGYLVEWTGSFSTAFAVTGGVVLSGAAAVALFVPSPLRPPAARPLAAPGQLGMQRSPRPKEDFVR